MITKNKATDACIQAAIGYGVCIIISIIMIVWGHHKNTRWEIEQNDPENTHLLSTTYSEQIKKESKIHRKGTMEKIVFRKDTDENL
eukprot:UN07360